MKVDAPLLGGLWRPSRALRSVGAHRAQLQRHTLIVGALRGFRRGSVSDDALESFNDYFLLL